MSASSHTVNEKADRPANGVEGVGRHDDVVPPMAEEEAAHDEAHDPFESFIAKLRECGNTTLSIPRKDFLRAMAHDLATIAELPDDKASLILQSNFMQYILGLFARGENE
ncbi:uncharacterized protein ARMOST_03843 [Armillaria ostoyae]|uniref:Uncharacterized protein n=1 Tax=Armillaria ostoyae TaxID=47428 RepID=A0A284QVM6_ARMOS|nr:uncharacterized protein ARMOST_03843 [Armillaria ostoyae]